MGTSSSVAAPGPEAHLRNSLSGEQGGPWLIAVRQVNLIDCNQITMLGLRRF